MKMMKTLFRWRFAGVISIILCGAVFAPCADENSPPFDVDQLLYNPDRMNLDLWIDKIDVMPAPDQPQQYYAVNVRAFMRQSPPEPAEAKSDLHFVMKIGKEGNDWDPGYDYERISAPAEGFMIEYSAGVLLRPGRYRIAIIVYDSVRKKGNVVGEHIKLAGLREDSAQASNGSLPDVQFSNKNGPMHNLSWPLSKDSLLPVKNKRPLCIDIVVNASEYYLYKKSNAISLQPSLLKYSSFFSHLKPSSGKIRVSILDALQMRTYVDRENAKDFDWMGAGKLLSEQDPDTVDAGLLRTQTKASEYFSDQIQKILKEDAGEPGEESPIKIIIVVSRGMQFPKNTPIQKITLRQGSASTHLFYFLIQDSARQYYDDLYKMLKSPHPKHYIVSDRRYFIEALKKLITKIENL
jgi:hypothetical protein